MRGDKRDAMSEQKERGKKEQMGRDASLLLAILETAMR